MTRMYAAVGGAYSVMFGRPDHLVPLLSGASWDLTGLPLDVVPAGRRLRRHVDDARLLPEHASGIGAQVSG